MPGSRRLRLPAVFLLGIVLAGVVSALIAVQLFSGFTRNQSYAELGREARGIARLYGDAARRAADEGTPAPDFAPAALELATGDQLFYAGAPAFPGQTTGLERLAESSIPAAARSARSSSPRRRTSSATSGCRWSPAWLRRSRSAASSPGYSVSGSRAASAALSRHSPRRRTRSRTATMRCTCRSVRVA